MLRRQLERYGQWLVAIAGLALLAAASTWWIFTEQRITTPLADRYSIRAEFDVTSGLEPGLGQPVTVAGVRVGSVGGIQLREGRALVSMDIDPGKLPRVHRNARATLVPNSPLKDLEVDLAPGGPPAGPLPDGGTIAIWSTESPTDLDELTATLDHDTRDFLQILVGSADGGLRARGRDLRSALKTLAPTTAQLRTVSAALRARRRELRRLVTNLDRLTTAAARKDDELALVVDRANATVSALAGQERDLREGVSKLPRTLTAARELVRQRDFTRALPGTADALLPPARELPGALRAVDALSRRGRPVIHDQLRPFAREAQPLARALGPTARDLSAVTPDLTRAFLVLRYLANELAHNPPGSDEGYLFWLAWAAHNLNSVLSTEDAHGAVFRGFDLVDCDNLSQQPPLVNLLTLATAPVPAC